jgi:tetratricopeptide (TPR) repeat protein
LRRFNFALVLYLLRKSVKCILSSRLFSKFTVTPKKLAVEKPWVKNWLGEPEAAIERFARAMRLSPLDPSLRTPSGTAHAHFFLGRYDEAASWAAMALQDNPDYQPGLRIAAASNAMAGRPEQAHKAVARLALLNPTLRVSTLKDVLGPFRRAEDLLRYEEGLRQAGLPE